MNLSALCRCLYLSGSLAFSTALAQAQSIATYTDLHDFGGTTENANGNGGLDGANPFASVVFDNAGNMY